VRWLVSRQVEGVQGRPNKPDDTCYTFWIGATLKLLDVATLVDWKEILKFVLTTQDPITGGRELFININLYFGFVKPSDDEY